MPLKVFSFLPLPLIILILGRGLREDRVFFSLYVLCVSLSAYLWSTRLAEVLPWAIALWVLAVLSLNCFFHSLLKGIRPSLYRYSHPLLIVMGLALVLLFITDYRPELMGKAFLFPHPLLPHLSMALLIFSTGAFILNCEVWERNTKATLSQRVFFGGTMFGWIIVFYFLIKMILSGDSLPFLLFDALLLLHLLLLLPTYFFLLRSDFLAVRLHPSPEFAVKLTPIILVLGAFAFLLWGDVLRWGWGRRLASYWDIVAFVTLALLGLLFALPLGPGGRLRESIFQHLYIPEQDFALEVKFYLELLGGRGKREKIVEHLRSKLKVEGVVFYKGKDGKFFPFASSPKGMALPQSLEGPPKKGTTVGGLRSLEVFNIGKGEGFLLLLDRRPRRLSQDERRLIRFWSLTLGMLMEEMERQQRRQLEEKMALFSQAASFILHDAKNMAQLLDLIVKNITTVEEEKEAREFLQELLPALKKASERAKRILGRIEAFNPEQKPALRNVEIAPLVKEVCEGLGEKVKFDSSRASSCVDPEFLKRVLENLLLNALQAAGSAEVLIREGKDEVLLGVCDRGPGVPEELREKIFEPFFTTRSGGTGLGLYQARLLLREMGGDIWYEPREGGGSCFWCRLPKEAADSGG
ncbi:MAG: hypothetical protein DRG36_04950 [Deltaproteobacteria bacterium]|nr:MAG: hypothetical protein DRG36_04950 [Deltaproteobacteria bacterium]